VKRWLEFIVCLCVFGSIGGLLGFGASGTLQGASSGAGYGALAFLLLYLFAGSGSVGDDV
jgi:hypothetical protein